MNRLIISTCLCLSLLSSALSAQRALWFTTEDNLSNNKIQSICADQNGFIYIGTENGLNRYDGYNFTNFYHNANDTLSLLSNYVRTLYTSSDGILWVGTNKGLQYMMPNSGLFHTVRLENTSQVFISKILKLSNGDIWVATSGRGIFRIRPNNMLYAENLDKITPQLGMDVCRTIHEDYSGMVWIGTPIGVFLCDPTTMRISAFHREVINGDVNSIHEDSQGYIYITTSKELFVWNSIENRLQTVTPQESIWDITHSFMDNNETLYISLRGNGLLRYNKELGQLVRLRQSINNYELDNLDISAMYHDQQGNIWMGCFLSGLTMIKSDIDQFNYYKFSDYQEQISGVVTAMMLDDGGNIWIGYNNKGLTAIDRDGNVIFNNPSQPHVSSLFKDSSGVIWVGLTSGGLSKLDPLSGKLTSVVHNDYSSIYCITEDSYGRLFYSELGQGFTRYTQGDTIAFTWSEIMSDSSIYSLSNNWIYAMYIDDNNYLWLGHDNGIDCYDIEKNIFLNVHPIRATISATSCYSIKEDSKKRLWFGTNMGLLMYDRRENKQFLYNETHGLSSRVINGIEEDALGNIWVSTQFGLNRINPETYEIDSYYSGSGLRDRTYNKVSVYNKQTDCIYFGSNNGITYFNPNAINTSTKINDIIITNFLVGNEPIDSQLYYSSKGKEISTILEADIFKLGYNNSFSIEFTTLNFGDEECITYEYSFDTARDRWITLPTGINTLNFSQLAAGQYNLSIRARMNDSLSSTKNIQIRVMPQWYLSIYAIIGYLSLLLLLLFMALRSAKIRNDRRISETKLHSFTNIAHEICTPMTMIISPLEELMGNKELDSNTYKQLEQMHRSSTRILRLIQQLLDLRKYDEGEMRLKYREVDIVNFVMGSYSLYMQTAESREIKYTFNYSVSNLPLLIDVDSIDKVMMNLLSNAFKYTPDKGSIEVKLDVDIDDDANTPLNSYVKISVIDSGIGIDSKELNKVFDRFYRAESSLYSTKMGMGIGLNYCRALVTLHKGKIWAENRTDGVGTIFSFTLPLGKSHIKPEDIVDDNPLVREDVDKIKLNSFDVDFTDNSTRSKKVMVVEDDANMLEYISTNLQRYYRVIRCRNGNEALRQTIAQRPDIIVTDVVMPEMDGITLLQRLKKNVETSHIPIIILSSKNQLQDRLEGLEMGADAYLSKPFYMNELRITINNLISNRLILKGKFANTRERKRIVEHTIFETTDDQLLRTISEVVHKNLQDCDFNIDNIVKELSISKSKLHRKIKEMTGFSPARFVMNIRMQESKRLLEEEGITSIAQIAFAVGFASPTHFSTTFKLYYGVTPSEYIEMLADNRDTDLQPTTLNDE